MNSLKTILGQDGNGNSSLNKIKEDYNSSTCQWNNKTRKELYDWILLEIDNFVSIQKKFNQAKVTNRISFPSMSMSRSSKVISSVEYLKWNCNEFEIDYPSLKNLFRVGKYYVAILLNEKPIVPYLIEIITSPIAFWNELKIRFHCSDNKEEQIYIVKSLIWMYQKHFQMIKELTCIAFWVKSLGDRRYSHLHFWILQLIFNALNIPFEEYSKANYKMFKKANGLSTIFGFLNFSFKELSKRSGSIDNDFYESCDKMSNFTGIKENLNYFERNSVEICQAIVIINILDKLLEKIEDFNSVPLPSFFQYLSKKRSLNSILQLFLIENADLTKIVTSFIFKHFKCHYTLVLLTENNLIEFLILGMHTKGKNKIMKIIDRINEFLPDFNEDIEYEDMISEEEKIAFNKLEPSSKIKIKTHPLWRFLPVTLLDVLNREMTLNPNSIKILNMRDGSCFYSRSSIVISLSLPLPS